MIFYTRAEEMKPCMNHTLSVFTILRHLMMILIFTWIFTIFLSANSKNGTFEEIGKLSCSDQYTNKFFFDLDSNLSSYGINRPLYMSLMMFLFACFNKAYCCMFRYERLCGSRSRAGKKSAKTPHGEVVDPVDVLPVVTNPGMQGNGLGTTGYNPR